MAVRLSAVHTRWQIMGRIERTGGVLKNRCPHSPAIVVSTHKKVCASVLSYIHWWPYPLVVDYSFHFCFVHILSGWTVYPCITKPGESAKNVPSSSVHSERNAERSFKTPGVLRRQSVHRHEELS